MLWQSPIDAMPWSSQPSMSFAVTYTIDLSIIYLPGWLVDGIRQRALPASSVLKAALSLPQTSSKSSLHCNTQFISTAFLYSSLLAGWKPRPLLLFLIPFQLPAAPGEALRHDVHNRVVSLSGPASSSVHRRKRGRSHTCKSQGT